MLPAFADALGSGGDSSAATASLSSEGPTGRGEHASERPARAPFPPVRCEHRDELQSFARREHKPASQSKACSPNTGVLCKRRLKELEASLHTYSTEVSLPCTMRI